MHLFFEPEILLSFDLWMHLSWDFQKHPSLDLQMHLSFEPEIYLSFDLLMHLSSDLQKHLALDLQMHYPCTYKSILAPLGPKNDIPPLHPLVLQMGWKMRESLKWQKSLPYWGFQSMSSYLTDYDHTGQAFVPW